MRRVSYSHVLIFFFLGGIYIIGEEQTRGVNMFCGLKMGHKVQNKVFLIANLKSFSIFSHHALEKKIFLLSARDQCAFPPNFRFFHNLGQCGVAAGPGPKFPVNNSPKGRKRTEVVDIYDFHLFEDCIQFSCSNLGQQMFFVTLFSFLNS